MLSHSYESGGSFSCAVRLEIWHGMYHVLDILVIELLEGRHAYVRKCTSWIVLVFSLESKNHTKKNSYDLIELFY